MHIVEAPTLKNASLRLLGTKDFPQDYDIEVDMAQDGPNAFMLEPQNEHLSGKRVREK